MSASTVEKVNPWSAVGVLTVTVCIVALVMIPVKCLGGSCVQAANDPRSSAAAAVCALLMRRYV